MEKIVIKRLDLKAVVMANRAKHSEIVTEALEEYRKRAIEELDRAIEVAKSGKKIWRMLSLIEPSDHTADYDRAIKMLEMDIRDTVEIDEITFKNLVMDDWAWKAQFALSNSQYTNKA